VPPGLFEPRQGEREARRRRPTKAGTKLPSSALKRLPRLPQPGKLVSGKVGVETLQPLKHVDLF
jgi:hypothetical protein